MILTNRKKLLSLLLCALLAWTVAFGITGCTDDKTPETPKTTVGATDPTESEESKPDTDEAPATTAGEIASEIGEGTTVFSFTIVDGDSKTEYRVRTDKTVVGDALMELGLIEGEEGPYGLYVKKVGGILADYEETGTYWAFYVNGEYAMSGVDATEIEPGAAYAFKVEK